MVKPNSTPAAADPDKRVPNEAAPDRKIPSFKIKTEVYTCPYFDFVPLLTPDEFAALVKKIKANGLDYPILVTEDNEVLDGYHRLLALAVLNFEGVSFKLVPGLTSEQKEERAYSANVHRRNLTTEGKRAMTAAALTRHPTWSPGQIADLVGVARNTAAAVRDELVADGKLAPLDKLVGKDGKARSAKRKKTQLGEQPAGGTGKEGQPAAPADQASREETAASPAGPDSQLDPPESEEPAVLEQEPADAPDPAPGVCPVGNDLPAEPAAAAPVTPLPDRSALAEPLSELLALAADLTRIATGGPLDDALLAVTRVATGCRLVAAKLDRITADIQALQREAA